MEKIRFGKTELMVSKVAFGGIPIQRLSLEEAVKVVRGAIDLGVNFIDTANGYTDSEEKIGQALKGLPRDSLVIATKSGANDKETFLKNLDLSLTRLGVEYVDIYQHHGVLEESYDEVFGENGAFEGMIEAVKLGKVRFPAFSSHNIPFAMKVMREGRFHVVQLPFNYVDDEAAKEAIPLAKELDMGFIAMKPFGGGLLNNANLCIKYLKQFDNIVPDPGIERLSEIEEIVEILNSGELLNDNDYKEIALLKEQLGDSWCHRCNYCQPCTSDIPISTILTVQSHVRRMPYARVVGMVSAGMEAARNCTQCKDCVSRCPYNLDIPKLLTDNVAFWDNYVAEHE
ncbi:MAG: aldo/keto reductase [Oscillospiraceae bacterium]|nr:aldo/keto reductase [Oscillospiraceae bacterium]